jgi:hypothetical protein
MVPPIECACCSARRPDGGAVRSLYRKMENMTIPSWDTRHAGVGYIQVTFYFLGAGAEWTADRLTAIVPVRGRKTAAGVGAVAAD